MGQVSTPTTALTLHLTTQASLQPLELFLLLLPTPTPPRIPINERDEGYGAVALVRTILARVVQVARVQVGRVERVGRVGRATAPIQLLPILLILCGILSEVLMNFALFGPMQPLIILNRLKDQEDRILIIFNIRFYPV